MTDNSKPKDDSLNEEGLQEFHFSFVILAKPKDIEDIEERLCDFVFNDEDMVDTAILVTRV